MQDQMKELEKALLRRMELGNDRFKPGSNDWHGLFVTLGDMQGQAQLRADTLNAVDDEFDELRRANAQAAADAYAFARGLVWSLLPQTVTDGVALTLPPSDLARLADVTAKLTRARARLKEVMSWHADQESADYNDCDKELCTWCEDAAKVFAEGLDPSAERVIALEKVAAKAEAVLNGLSATPLQPGGYSTLADTGVMQELKWALETYKKLG